MAIVPNKEDFPVKRNSAWVFVVFGIGLAATLLATDYARKSREDTYVKEFRNVCSDIQIKISDRLRNHALLLRGGAALFSASDSVTRSDWKIYFEGANVEKNLPGIQGLGYSIIIGRNELKDHIKKIRDQGFPHYRIRPETARDFYTSIVYLEPFDSINRRAFGYDMFSEPVRRRAMEIACDSNIPALTGKVKLVQETATDIQAGTLMYVPVYKHGMSTKTVEERRKAIKGWVYSPYRMNNLMKGILGRWENDLKNVVHLQIYDTSTPSEKNLLYDSQRERLNPQADYFREELHVQYNGTNWTLVFTESYPWGILKGNNILLVLISGFIISLLLSLLTFLFLNTRYRAQQIATRLTTEIRESATRLELATKAGGVGIWDLDAKSSTFIWDDQMYALYGVTKENFKGDYHSWLNLIHPKNSQEEYEKIRLALSGLKEYNSEFSIVWPDGSIHIIRGLAVVLRDESNQALHMIGTNWDITDQKNNETALVNAKKEAEAANRAKSEFLANMSHEIRTPMNAILGYSELLTSRITNKKEIDYLDAIKSSGRSLLSIINDILDISKIEAGKMKLDYDFIESHSFFDEFRKIFQLRINEKGLEFTTEIAPETPAYLYIDGPRLRQIILNLVGNSVKFTNNGYIKLYVSTDNKRSDKKDPEKEKLMLDLKIEVTDTGIGIPYESQKDIFESFVQVNSKTAVVGTGLGLPITKRLTELMNGNVYLESEPGSGSKFIVAIPGICYLDSRITQHDKEEIKYDKVTFGKSTIIVVDDNSSNRAIIRDSLGNTGIIVIEASDGFTALNQANELMPDLVIADIMMPEFDGFALLNELKNNEKLKDIPVIAYSASAMKEQQERIRNSKFSDFLIKPVQLNDLFEVLMKYLPYSYISNENKNESSELYQKEVVDIEGLISALEGSMTIIWHSFDLRQPIGEVKKFGTNLVKLGLDHKCFILTDYGKKIVSATENFNIDAMLKLLRDYPSLVTRIKY